MLMCKELTQKTAMLTLTPNAGQTTRESAETSVEHKFDLVPVGQWVLRTTTMNPSGSVLKVAERPLYTVYGWRHTAKIIDKLTRITEGLNLKPGDTVALLSRKKGRTLATATIGADGKPEMESIRIEAPKSNREAREIMRRQGSKIAIVDNQRDLNRLLVPRKAEKAKTAEGLKIAAAESKKTAEPKKNAEPKKTAEPKKISEALKTEQPLKIERIIALHNARVAPQFEPLVERLSRSQRDALKPTAWKEALAKPVATATAIETGAQLTEALMPRWNRSTEKRKNARSSSEMLMTPTAPLAAPVSLAAPLTLPIWESAKLPAANIRAIKADTRRESATRIVEPRAIISEKGRAEGIKTEGMKPPSGLRAERPIATNSWQKIETRIEPLRAELARKGADGRFATLVLDAAMDLSRAKREGRPLSPEKAAEKTDLIKSITAMLPQVATTLREQIRERIAAATAERAPRETTAIIEDLMTTIDPSYEPIVVPAAGAAPVIIAMPSAPAAISRTSEAARREKAPAAAAKNTPIMSRERYNELRDKLRMAAGRSALSTAA